MVLQLRYLSLISLLVVIHFFAQSVRKKDKGLYNVLAVAIMLHTWVKNATTCPGCRINWKSKWIDWYGFISIRSIDYPGIELIDVNKYDCLPTAEKCREEIDKVKENEGNKNTKKVKIKRIKKRFLELSGG